MRTDILVGLEGAELAGALKVLDRISRPLEVRELDTLFAKAGVSRTLRKPAIRALQGVAIVAVVGAG